MKLIIVVFSLVFGFGYANAHNSPALDMDSIEDLKTAIISIALEETSKNVFLAESPERDEAARSRLLPLINRLKELGGPQKVEDQLRLSIGGWQNLWSDLPTFGQNLYADSIYQAVYAEGFYYNISRGIEDGNEYTDVLKGEFRVRKKKNRLSIRFTRNYVLPSWIGEQNNFVEFGNQVASGEFDEFDETSFLNPFPLVKFIPQTLVTEYVDADIRIISGGGGLRTKKRYFVLVPADLTGRL